MAAKCTTDCGGCSCHIAPPCEHCVKHACPGCESYDCTEENCGESEVEEESVIAPSSKGQDDGPSTRK